MADYWSKILRQRLSRRRILAATGATGAGGLLLAACGGDSDGTKQDVNQLVAPAVDTTKQAKRGGVLKERTASDVPSLSVSTGGSAPHNNINHPFSGFVAYKPGYLEPSKNEVVGDVFESWEYSPDGLQLSMKLRQGVKFHPKPPINGRLLDMDDIKFTLDQFASTSTSRDAILNQFNAQAPVLSYTPVDGKTLVLKLKEPVTYVLDLLTEHTASSGLAIRPKETDTAFDSRSDMIGTGPFYLVNYTPSVGFTFKRHPDYWDKDFALVDQVEQPIISEYAAALSQFKAGNIYTMGSSSSANVNGEDILTVKRDEPRLLIYEGDLARTGGVTNGRFAFGWLPAGQSPFADERVRQAVSMALDRDLYLDTFYNVSKYEAQGMPVTSAWNTAVEALKQGWWLDPKSKDFGPNAKYYVHNPAEAKKLLAAAGYPNGFNTTSHTVTGPELGEGYKHSLVVDNMVGEIGIKSTIRPIDYRNEYQTGFRDGYGQYEGWAHVSTGGAKTGQDATATLAAEYWAKGRSVAFKGFDVNGRGDQSGDPQLELMIEKARLEHDTEKRRAMIFELQRYLAKPQYTIPWPGLASGFTMAWPCVGNYRVYRGNKNERLWVDETKPPFKPA